MTPQRAIFLFAAASLLPAILLAISAVFGGVWAYATLLSVTLLVVAMDRLGPGFEAHDSLSRWLPWAVGAFHFICLYLTIWAIGQTGILDTGQKVALGVSMGLFAGQVSNACAHELIHRTTRASRWLGIATYSSILNGQHVSSHLLVHHLHAGTAKDPCSAPAGRGYYRFAVAAAKAEFIEGWRAETRRRAQRARAVHPFTIYLGGAGFSLCLSFLLSGWVGVAALVAISLHAQMQLLLSDYVQHYGLRRKIGSDGKAEAMGPQHSWNAPYPFSAALMMNATRHSDHHLQPGRSFPELRLEEDTMPMLPRSMPVMGAIALFPPLWRHVMDPRVARWSSDVPHAAPASVSQPVMSR